MGSQTKVSIRTAAKMAGVSRKTFYKHIDEKGISLEDKDSARPKVDVSELIRVYGNNIKTLEEVAEEDEKKKNGDEEPADVTFEEKIELHTLRIQNKHLEELRQSESKAARDKAEQQSQQIEHLKDLLESERDERRRATALITDQRGEKEKHIEKITALETELSTIKNAGFFARLFGRWSS